MKVVWIAGFSNPFVRQYLPVKVGRLESFLMHLFHRVKPLETEDSAPWVTNALKEIVKFPDVEVHVISPYGFLARDERVFSDRNIRYYFFRNEFFSFKERICRQIDRHYRCSYRNNIQYIVDRVIQIRPDIIHVIGAENLEYSLSLLKMPHNCPTIVQLQTLVNDPNFRNNYPLPENVYEYMAYGEKRVIECADFLGATASYFIPIVRSKIKNDVIALNTTLPLTEPVEENVVDKEYDFVYFAKSINKAADWAIEAFALAHASKPELTLDVIGAYTPDCKMELDCRIKQLGLEACIHFEGSLPTHDDVIRQIRKSRFAVLPIKVDLITGTIRESMANGVPVVTTITPATPTLNRVRQSVLLSEKGNFKAMADNMLLLVSDSKYAEMIKENARITASERESNYSIVSRWVEAYKVCISNFRQGTPIPDSYLTK